MTKILTVIFNTCLNKWQTSHVRINFSWIVTVDKPFNNKIFPFQGTKIWTRYQVYFIWIGFHQKVNLYIHFQDREIFEQYNSHSLNANIVYFVFIWVSSIHNMLIFYSSICFTSMIYLGTCIIYLCVINQ